MSANRVRRGASGGGRRPARSSKARVAVPKKIASKLPMKQASANRLATWMFGLFVLALAVVAAIALELPAKIGRLAGEVMAKVSGTWPFATDGCRARPKSA